mgnify:CR=1 FL=1
MTVGQRLLSDSRHLRLQISHIGIITRPPGHSRHLLVALAAGLHLREELLDLGRKIVGVDARG